MGSKRRAASKSWQSGLRPVSAIPPAMLGPVIQSRRRFAGRRNSNLRGERGKSWACPTFLAPRHRKDGQPRSSDPAAAGDRRRRPPEPPGSTASPVGPVPDGPGRPVDGAGSPPREIQDLDAAAASAARGPDGRYRQPGAGRLPARSLAARSAIGVGRIVDPRHAAREQRRGKTRPGNPRATAGAGAPPATRPPPTAGEAIGPACRAARMPRSRPGHRHDARPADGECRADGRPRAAGGSALRALPAEARAAWPDQQTLGHRGLGVRAGLDAAASAADSGRRHDRRSSPTIRRPTPRPLLRQQRQGQRIAYRRTSATATAGDFEQLERRQPRSPRHREAGRRPRSPAPVLLALHDDRRFCRSVRG